MLLKTRLRVLLVSIGALAAAVTVGVAANEKEDIRQFAEVERVARSETLTRVFDLTARARATWVYDNTFWDDAVEFVRGGGSDLAWAEVSYGESLGGERLRSTPGCPGW